MGFCGAKRGWGWVARPGRGRAAGAELRFEAMLGSGTAIGGGSGLGCGVRAGRAPGLSQNYGSKPRVGVGGASRQGARGWGRICGSKSCWGVGRRSREARVQVLLRRGAHLAWAKRRFEASFRPACLPLRRLPAPRLTANRGEQRHFRRTGEAGGSRRHTSGEPGEWADF